MTTLQVHCEIDYHADADADYVFNLEAAFHPTQKILEERFGTEPFAPVTSGLDSTGLNRLTKVQGPRGEFRVRYDAVVTVDYPLPTGREEEMTIQQLPVEVIPYIWASRYCESDAIMPMAVRTFGHLPKGYQRIEAICQWIRDHIVYQIGTSGPSTSARDVLVNRAGVCRDYAHLGVTFCRALNIPARLVSGYTWYQEPPPDFHAIFEAYLGGRWVLFDPTQLASVTDVVRIATGRDAAYTAFATIFGPVKMLRWRPEVVVLPEPPLTQAPPAR